MTRDAVRTTAPVSGDADVAAPGLHPHVLERFEIGRCLGAGSFGVVYAALDRRTSSSVALKKLSLLEASAIYGFKQEFRALADVSHPNLVGLHELISEGDGLYLVMELVEGTDFLTYARGQAHTPAPPDAPTLVDEDHVESGPRSMVTPPARMDLLRPAMRQLTHGVLAIHRARKLHRDIKPSNVRVTTTGVVKILDFGLISGLSASASHKPAWVVGTPAYMSPEQAAGAPLGPASDWYSVGVILYEALTGALPIDGDVREILAGKQAIDAPDPRAVAPSAPDDLAELCVGLLQRDPRARPTGAAAIRALGEDPSADPDVDVGPLVGREHHLATLDEAFAVSRAGHAVVVLVHGTSGMGKTALCRRFLDAAAETHGALIFEGRSYERESVPFKALDPLVDALAVHLGALPREEVDALLPPDIAALARLFPVLRRANAIADAPLLSEGIDPQEVRRRASAALRALLARVAARAPLVLSLDDLQWGDADSASILLDLVSPPDAPPLLLVAGYRSEDAASIDLVSALLRRMSRGEPAPDVREIFVGPLSPRESRSLARALVAASDDDEIDTIARESGGNPFFVGELARHVGDHEPVSLRGVLARRVSALPVHARRLLSAIAAAGRPTAAAALERAAAVDDPGGALAILRSQRLVRVHAQGSVRELSAAHDRIRESALVGVPPDDLAALHLRLARALDGAGSADPEALAFHYDAGGEADKAREHAETAARRAAEAHAFRRAAELYRRALEGSSDRRPLLIALGHALANAGRGAEAGRAYLDACEGSEPGEALDLRRRAAEQVLRAGHVDEGLAAVRDVLGAVDLSLPRTPARAFASLLYRRARLSLRGLELKERVREASPAELTRIDVCWSVGNGLQGVDIVRGADFQSRHLYYALEAGDPYRVSRALSSEAIFAAMEGGRGGPARAARLLDRARAIAERIEHPHAVAWAAGAAAGSTFYASRWSDAVTLGDRAIRLFRGTCTDITWELGSIVCWWLLPALYYLGRIDELSHRLPAYLKEAEELGALYNLTSLRTLTAPRLLIARDRPADARAEARDAIARWSSHGWHTQHWCVMFTGAQTALYEGDGIAAHAEIEGSFGELDRSLLLRVESVRIESLYLRGAAAIGAIGSGADPGPARRIATQAARALGRETSAFAKPFSLALRAAVALTRGQGGKAIGLLADAEKAFGGLEMGLHAAAARRQRGELMGGDEGRVLIEGADAWLIDHGMMRPDRVSAMLVPLSWGEG